MTQDDVRWLNYYIGWLSGNPDLRLERKTGNVLVVNHRSLTVATWNMETGTRDE